MAFAATNSTGEPRAYSIGPVKIQVLDWTCASGDTSGTVTADSLTSIISVIVGTGLLITTAPTFSGNVATLTFTDPAANRAGSVIVIGK
jgi:hypothetical protein